MRTMKSRIPNESLDDSEENDELIRRIDKHRQNDQDGEENLVSSAVDDVAPKKTFSRLTRGGSRGAKKAPEGSVQSKDRNEIEAESSAPEKELDKNPANDGAKISDDAPSSSKPMSFLSRFSRGRGDVGNMAEASSKPTSGSFFRRGGSVPDTAKKSLEDPDPGDIENGIAEKGKEKSLYLGPMKVLEPMRTDVVKALQARQKRIERLAAITVPEIHYTGQILSGRNISFDATEGIICRWKIEHGKCWELLGGDIIGQTQVSYCAVKENEEIAFNHPLDLHFAEAGVPGWGSPRISFQCFRMDWHGRRVLAGYGFCHLPSTAGCHKLEVPIWRPTGTVDEELHAFFLGRTPALATQEPIFESAWRDRCRLVTVSSGTLNVEVFVTTRFARQHNFDVAPLNK